MWRQRHYFAGKPLPSLLITPLMRDIVRLNFEAQCREISAGFAAIDQLFSLQNKI
jgi:hypothetical protein